jgi:acetyl-CoA synthetase
VVIFATLKQGVEPSQELKNKIKQHIRKTMGPVVTPDEIYFVTKLPKTRSGKIMRRVLKAVASGTKIGDLTTLEDEASVEEVKKAFEELQKKV